MMSFILKNLMRCLNFFYPVNEHRLYDRDTGLSLEMEYPQLLVDITTHDWLSDKSQDTRLGMTLLLTTLTL